MYFASASVTLAFNLAKQCYVVWLASLWNDYLPQLCYGTLARKYGQQLNDSQLHFFSYRKCLNECNITINGLCYCVMQISFRIVSCRFSRTFCTLFTVWSNSSKILVGPIILRERSGNAMVGTGRSSLGELDGRSRGSRGHSLTHSA